MIEYDVYTYLNIRKQGIFWNSFFSLDLGKCSNVQMLSINEIQVKSNFRVLSLIRYFDQRAIQTPDIKHP